MLILMLDYLAKENSVRVSVEVEKVGRNFEDFIPLADVVFVSKVKLSKSRRFLFFTRTWLNGMDVLIWSRRSQSSDQNFDKALPWSLLCLSLFWLLKFFLLRQC